MDRFIEAMIAIKSEIKKVQEAIWPKNNNPLSNAPHTQADLLAWNKPYSIQEGIFPIKGQENNKFWPSVNRIDDVYGDRNLMCACPPVSDYS
jgi:glycine dehydrogenase